MNRRQLKSNRFLPTYVSRFKDRHGKDRLRFRRKGYPDHYFRSPLGTEDFRIEYAHCMDPNRKRDAAEATAQKRITPGTIDDLLYQYLAVPTRLGPTETTQAKVRSILERFANGRGDRPVALITFQHIDKIIAKAREKRTDEKGRVIGGVEAARKLRKELRRLFAFARKIKMITDNPVEESEKIKVAPAERSAGYYPWTEEDIDQYRFRWPLGTKQRLAMELLLWTDQRKVDTIHLGPQHIKGGQFVIRQTKTGKTLRLRIATQLREAIDAMPRSDALCFIVTEYGKPFSVKGFGGWFRDQCDAAGLPQCTAHGLRKAMMRRMAELEMSQQSLKAVSGHSKDEEVARYVESANQSRLADAAITRVEAWEKANRDDGVDVQSA